MNAGIVLVLLCLPATVAAQAGVEAAAVAGRAAVSTGAAAKKLSKSIGGMLDNVNRGLQNQDKTKSGTKSTPAVAAHAKDTMPAESKSGSTGNKTKVETATAFEDPSGIQAGMERSEVLRRFGPPSLGLTTGPGDETLSYYKNGVSVDAKLRDGKVTAVEKSGEPNQPTIK